MRGLWLPILVCLVFWAVVGHAILEKVSEHEYKIQQDVTKDLTQTKRLIQSLETDITRKQDEIVKIQAQIVNLQKEIDDAVVAGVVDRTPIEEMMVDGSITEGGI